MDRTEEEFLLDFGRRISNINKSITETGNSKYGLSKSLQQVEGIARQLVKNKSRGGTPSVPPYFNNDFDESMTLEPIPITPEMIKEIKELEDELLPEYANRKQIEGNPSLKPNNQVQQNNIQSDPNQLEFNFDKISVDDVYQQYETLLKEFTLFQKRVTKELKVIKGLVEDFVNNEQK
jgi:hypothetical protein